MKYKVSFTEKANNELNQSIDWYNDRKKGLGKRFYLKINEAIKIISKNPYAFELKLNNFRWTTVNNFPFIVIYFIADSQNIVITAIFHTSRNPNSIDNY